MWRMSRLSLELSTHLPLAPDGRAWRAMWSVASLSLRSGDAALSTSRGYRWSPAVNVNVTSRCKCSSSLAWRKKHANLGCEQVYNELAWPFLDHSNFFEIECSCTKLYWLGLIDIDRYPDFDAYELNSWLACGKIKLGACTWDAVRCSASSNCIWELQGFGNAREPHAQVRAAPPTNFTDPRPEVRAVQPSWPRRM